MTLLAFKIWLAGAVLTACLYAVAAWRRSPYDAPPRWSNVLLSCLIWPVIWLLIVAILWMSYRVSRRFDDMP